MDYGLLSASYVIKFLNVIILTSIFYLITIFAIKTLRKITLKVFGNVLESIHKEITKEPIALAIYSGLIVGSIIIALSFIYIALAIIIS